MRIKLWNLLLLPGTDARGRLTTGSRGRAATCTSCGAPPTTSTSTRPIWPWVRIRTDLHCYYSQDKSQNCIRIFCTLFLTRQPSCYIPVLAKLDTFHPDSANLSPLRVSPSWSDKETKTRPFISVHTFPGVTTERSDKFNDMYYQKPTWFARKYTYHDKQGIWYSSPELIIHAKTTTR